MRKPFNREQYYKEHEEFWIPYYQRKHQLKTNPIQVHTIITAFLYEADGVSNLDFPEKTAQILINAYNEDEQNFIDNGMKLYFPDGVGTDWNGVRETHELLCRIKAFLYPVDLEKLTMNKRQKQLV